ncbi:MAG: DJ-1/PfpI family protein [Bdellovibrionaceae bacterium]|nr:DJ-1/PfpI family protein [Pseudobdellovibrionaceae bacterium]
MKIGIVVFNEFTDLDFYLPWDLLNRVRLLNLSNNWKVEILGDDAQYTSAAGLTLMATKPYSFATECDAVYFCSGSKTKELIKNKKFLDNFKLVDKQIIAAIDSGALILAAIGLLNGKKATTYPTTFELLKGFGVNVQELPFVIDGNIATGARCLSGDKLALWIIQKLAGADISEKVFDSVKPLNQR